MDFSLTEEQQAIQESVRRTVDSFSDDYWLGRERAGEFPEECYQAMARNGWVGVAMPEAYGGANLGVTEAALMMMEVANSGGGMTAASALHINIFGPHPIVVFGTEEQKQRWLPPLIEGKEKTCFGITEPDAGLDTTSITTRAELKGDHYIVHGKKVWTSTAQHAHKIMLLARTTPLEQCKRPTDGLSLFYTDLNREYVDVVEIEK
ncbi:MAG: acyl-CoA/acyl-ACP dehydrogenase, partial [Alteromonadaceae bacterium]|nr:acyl-CoA/acyl-ACP dehydrogenase [Alteromonadaceae bacterium]